LGNTYDIPTILKAAELLKDRHVPVRFIIAGDGPLRPEVEKATQREDARLIYVGRLKYEDLIRVYKHCDVGLCAYASGSTVGMPDKAYDYLAAGLVIVSSLRGELATWLKEKQCGVQYQAGDAESLATVLERLTVYTDSREVMAKNSYDTAMLFDRHVQYRKYVEWVETLCTTYSIDNEVNDIAYR
jgi:glycosyltransferase involved in cell wall biosynthesis